MSGVLAATPRRNLSAVGRVASLIAQVDGSRTSNRGGPRARAQVLAGVAPVVERAAQTLADAAPRPFTVATSLTGNVRRAAWDARRPRPGKPTAAAVAPLPATCRSCGSELPNRKRRYCDRCRQASAERAGHSGRTAAAAALGRLRDQGRDPAHGGEVALRRGPKNAAHQGVVAQWDSSKESWSEEAYTRHCGAAESRN
jgi:hypothetical protein